MEGLPSSLGVVAEAEVGMECEGAGAREREQDREKAFSVYAFSLSCFLLPQDREKA